MSRLILSVLIAALWVTGSAAQWGHSFIEADMRNDGSVYIRVDGDPGTNIIYPQCKIAVICRRGQPFDDDGRFPYWMNFSSVDRRSTDAWENSDPMPLVFFSPHVSGNDSTAWVLDGDPLLIHDGVDIGYMFQYNGVASPVYYENMDRTMDPEDPSSGATVTSVFCSSAWTAPDGYGELTCIAAPSADAALRLEVYDSVGASWVSCENLHGGNWTQYLEPGYFGGNFFVPTPLVTDGQTRVYFRSLDGVEHGPVTGPLLTVSCNGIVVDDGGDPAIATVEVDAGDLVIYGANFGQKGPLPVADAPPVLWDTVNNQSAYSGLSDGDLIPVGVGYPWADYYSSDGVDAEFFYEDDDLRVQGRHIYSTNGNGAGYFQSHEMWADSTEYHNLVIDWFVRRDDAYIATSNKYIRIWPDENGWADNVSNPGSICDDFACQRVSWTAQHLTVRGISADCTDPEYGGPPHINWDNTDIGTDTWSHMEAVVLQGYDLANNLGCGNPTGATIQCTRLGQSLQEVDASSWEAYRRLQEFGFENDNATGTYDLCTVYMDTTLARLKVANTSDLSTSSAYEMLCPVYWATDGDSIRVEPNFGVFESGETVYVFVCTADGVWSDGAAYEIP